MRRIIGCLCALFVLSALPAARAAGTNWRIETVATRQGSGEPSLTQDSSGTWTYFVAPEDRATVWRKGPGGHWSGPTKSLGAGGDSDVAVDDDGVVYVSDLFGTNSNRVNPVSVSFDHAKSFRYVSDVELPPTVGPIPNDRQWLVVWGHGHVLNTSRRIEIADDVGSELAWVSSDQGRHFSSPVVATGSANVFIAGKPVRSAAGIIYLPYVAWDAFPGSLTPTVPVVSIATSADGGFTWAQHQVAVIGGVVPAFPAVTTDAAGRVYVVWMQSRGIVPSSVWWTYDELVAYDLGGSAMLASSTDEGGTWSTPREVSDPAQTVAFPWITAGAPGHVAVGWYGSHAVVDTGPDAALPITHWDVDVAESVDAAHHWTQDVAAADVHTGSICMQGIACASPEAVGLLNAPLPFDRRLLDFFSGWITPQGHLIIAYVHDRPALTGDPNDLLTTANDFMVAVQLRGPRLR